MGIAFKLLIASILLSSCSVTQSFYNRKYMPGRYHSKNENNSNNISQSKKALFTHQSDVISENNVRHFEGKKSEILSNNSSPVPVEKIILETKTEQPFYPVAVLAADTIPPQEYIATKKELRNGRILSSSCVAVLISSWILLPVIGWIVFFLIQFCIGSIPLIVSDIFSGNNNKYLKVMGKIALISLIGVAVLGIFSLVFCSFLNYCG